MTSEFCIIGPTQTPAGQVYRIEARAFSMVQAVDLVKQMWGEIAAYAGEKPVFIRTPPTIERHSDFDTKQVFWKGLARFTVMHEQENIKFGEMLPIENSEMIQAVTAIIQWLNDRPKGWPATLLNVRQMLIELEESKTPGVTE